VGNAIPMGAVMGTTALVSIVVLWTVVRPSSVPALGH
jgi:DHA1 family bicyclomycin/chloramphenicol resistance-like MFS transporter